MKFQIIFVEKNTIKTNQKWCRIFTRLKMQRFSGFSVNSNKVILKKKDDCDLPKQSDILKNEKENH